MRRDRRKGRARVLNLQLDDIASVVVTAIHDALAPLRERIAVLEAQHATEEADSAVLEAQMRGHRPRTAARGVGAEEPEGDGDRALLATRAGCRRGRG